MHDSASSSDCHRHQVDKSEGLRRLAKDEQLLQRLMELVPNNQSLNIEDPPQQLTTYLAGLSSPRLLGIIEICVALLITQSSE